jgi:hypothetical protein
MATVTQIFLLYHSMISATKIALLTQSEWNDTFAWTTSVNAISYPTPARSLDGITFYAKIKLFLVEIMTY